MKEYIYFINYVIKQKGSTALVDENSMLWRGIPQDLSLVEMKRFLLNKHNVDPSLYYCHISVVNCLGGANDYLDVTQLWVEK